MRYGTMRYETIPNKLTIVSVKYSKKGKVNIIFIQCIVGSVKTQTNKQKHIYTKATVCKNWPPRLVVQLSSPGREEASWLAC